MATWSSVLDEMERRLDQAGRAIDAGRFSFDPVAIPADLGPLPDSQRRRVEELHRATLDMQHRVEAAMAGTEGQLARRPWPVQSRPQPTYVDRRA